MSSNSTTPDLASVLSILAGLTPQTQTLLSQPQTQPSLTASAPQQQWLPTPHPVPPPRSTTPPEPPPSAVKVVDPAMIVEWSSGLRCVMKTVARHEGVLLEIRRMIKNQHEHEEMWFKGRKDLIERQNGRKEGQKKLDDVLKLVGGSVTEGTSNASPEELKKELETYDMKVYRAQTQMVKEMMGALRRVGVPFFGTRTELVRVAGKEAAGGKDGSGMIDEGELVKLQRKMLVILEDLCSE
ncbi:hypothetical protein D0Z07_3735 [Hyphodiscus hymeniophilus]|uniref:Uncharacterized protein n=1 Tax=Hyphodiscus hymeniophilus TaxID=353542 RepID=A0A9P6VL14_9HELO|nr:hypothetical protein D0Z07_3735 [Hyphodiscus hymeniophilus]